MEKTLDAEYFRLLHELQAADFVLVELTLYLDTHPEDRMALTQFNQYALKRRDLSCEYEQKYGPLMQFGRSYSAFPWQWNQVPWPWQV